MLGRCSVLDRFVFVIAPAWAHSRAGCVSLFFIPDSWRYVHLDRHWVRFVRGGGLGAMPALGMEFLLIRQTCILTRLGWGCC